MTTYNKTDLKTFFQNGDVPTGQNYSDFIDSCVNLVETSAQDMAGPLSTTELVTPRVSATTVNITGDLTLSRVTASAATINNLLSGNNASFSGTVSASTVNTTGDIQAATGKITASAATVTGKLTGATASFSGKVSADAGINTTTVSAASIGITGDLNASTGRITASAATFTSKLTGQAASFSALVSAKAGLNTTTVSAASIGITGDINAATGRVIASAATISSLLTGATATFSGIVSANALNITTDISAVAGSVYCSALRTTSGVLEPVAIISAAGTTQATSALLTATINRLQGVTDGSTTGFILSNPIVGLTSQYLINETALSANLWPAVGCAINGNAANTVFALAGHTTYHVIHSYVSGYGVK